MSFRILREPALQNPLLLFDDLADSPENENAPAPNIVDNVLFVNAMDTAPRMIPMTRNAHQDFFPK